MTSGPYSRFAEDVVAERRWLDRLDPEHGVPAVLVPTSRLDDAIGDEALALAAETRSRAAAQEREATRPMTGEELLQYEQIEEVRSERESDDVPWRTLADVPDEPPPSLMLGWLEHGPNLAIAAPGVGKGTTGAWTCVEAERAGLKVLVYDAERRPREWARRVSGLGGDRSRVGYIEPPDLGPKLAGRPLWDAAPKIRKLVQRAGVDLLLVDSIMPAVGLTEDRLKSDPSVPFQFTGALELIGVPSLSFGHPPKGQPEGDPFGSFAWNAAARLTWLGTTAEGGGHRIRWRPRKRNERGHIGGFLLTVEYGDDGRPCLVTRADDDENTRGWVLGALALGARSVASLAEELVDQMENPPLRELDRAKERVSKSLRRMGKEELVEHAPGGKTTWRLRVPS